MASPTVRMTSSCREGGSPGRGRGGGGLRTAPVRRRGLHGTPRAHGALSGGSALRSAWIAAGLADVEHDVRTHRRRAAQQPARAVAQAHPEHPGLDAPEPVGRHQQAQRAVLLARRDLEAVDRLAVVGVDREAEERGAVGARTRAVRPPAACSTSTPATVERGDLRADADDAVEGVRACRRTPARPGPDRPGRPTGGRRRRRRPARTATATTSTPSSSGRRRHRPRTRAATTPVSCSAPPSAPDGPTWDTGAMTSGQRDGGARRRAARLDRLHRHPGDRRGPRRPRPVPRRRAGRRGRARRPARRAGARARRRGRRRLARHRGAGPAAGLLRRRAGPRLQQRRVRRAQDPRRPRRGHRARRLAVRHRAQRHDRLGRPGAHAGRARRRPHPRAGQQGVAGRRRPARAGGRAAARPARARRLRAQRPRAVPARRARRRGAPARPDRERRTVPRAPPRRAGRRDARAGAGAPDLGHGPGHHDQLGDAGQQGPRGRRGAPAVRHALRPHRRRRAPAVAGALDGRVRRRLDARAGQPARHAPADRAGARLARPPAAPGATAWTGSTASTWEFEPLDDAGLPGRGAVQGGRGARRHVARRAQRRQRGLRRGLRRRAAAVPRHRRHGRGGARGAPARERATLADVLEAEEWARTRARELVDDRTRRTG